MSRRASRSDILKEEFAKRLSKLCDDSDLIPKGHGRVTELAKHFDLAVESVRRWLNGTNYPDIDHAEKISELFGANVGWLLTGKGVPYRHQLTEADEIHYTGMRARFLPILTPSQSLKFTGKYLDIEIDGWWPTDLKHGDFWLKVSGSAMDDGSRNAIKSGSLILVDTSLIPKNEDFVIFRIADLDAPIFKQLIEDGPNKFAASLNDKYPSIPLIENEYSVIGKVIDAIYRPMRRE